MAWTRDGLDGAVFAEPLIYHGSVYVATENDSVYALDAATGSIDWRLHLATASLNPGFSCGTDINPIGITSTPVIDSRRGILYAAGIVIAFALTSTPPAGGTPAPR